MKKCPVFARIVALVLMSQLFMSCFGYRPLERNQRSKPIAEIVKKISINKLHMVKLTTGITIKIKIKRVDDEAIYGTLYQKDIFGVEQRYENDKVLISNVNNIKVRKIGIPRTVLAFGVIPITTVAIIAMATAVGEIQFVLAN